MDGAADVLIDALTKRHRIIVFADYDVDGACSAAQLVRWFRRLNYDLPIYVPDRISEGYGPSPAAFRRLRAEGADLVITVDCGAAAHDALAEAHKIGLKVVVVDHHLMRGAPPQAAALINPNRQDCASGMGMLSASGVTFILLVALNREARRRGLFTDAGEPDVREWLDLVALGTICDVMQLVGFNRALAVHGLRCLAKWGNPGLAALMDVAGVAKASPGVFEAGFILGPRINAGGRVGRADLGARLLSTDDAAEARELAERLDALNIERKAVEAETVDQACRLIEADGGVNPADPSIVIAQDGWHPGVLGIVAGRLRERYRKPVFVLGIDPAADIAKGSGRSQPGVNLGRAIGLAFERGLLLSGGGHEMAAGATLRPADIPAFRDFLNARLADEAVVARQSDTLDVDVLVTPDSARRDLLEAFQKLSPFGPGNPEPVFALADVTVERPFPMRGGHLRCNLVGGGGVRLKAVAWRCDDTELGAALKVPGRVLHVVGRLKPDDWNGRSGVQFEVEDVADPRRTGSAVVGR
jgi:single-stranded-DNA-specific exonuclease